jgi:hypothetical protein
MSLLREAETLLSEPSSVEIADLNAWPNREGRIVSCNGNGLVEKALEPVRRS